MENWRFRSKDLPLTEEVQERRGLSLDIGCKRRGVQNSTEGEKKPGCGHRRRRGRKKKA